MASFSLKELPIGAEISGLPAKIDYEGTIRDELYKAWLEHGVLVFRNIGSVEQHLDLSRCFGELELHPLVDQRSKEHPLMMEVGGKRRARAVVYDQADVRTGRIPWHRDIAYTPGISKGAILRLLDLPESEGQTMFADTARAYDGLPPDVQQRLERLEYRAIFRVELVQDALHGAFWNQARWATREEDPDGPESLPASALDKEKVSALYPAVVHPALLVHPETQRKCVFVSPKDFDYFIGMERSESAELMAYLVSHLLNPKHIYKHEWKPNDALLWDNRRFLHAAAGNRVDQQRWGLRTTIAGLTQSGRYFDEGATAGAPPVMD